ncbi:MAG: FAD-dependent thymidylate synthase [candidate division WOR-3 bacterium]|nr:MAG: FAD-dependent thymidylate synthase [candidate division WOR-3 bacterium]
MRVILSGHNIDLDGLREMKDGKVFLTPESISAAYARISRSPKSIELLRENARHEAAKARESNRRIIFEMGHHSVAEHAVFNFDIIGISRRAVEEFERFRLCSYTEKSQRYVTLKGDYTVPRELKDKRLCAEFRTAVRLQNDAYRLFLRKITEYNEVRFPQLTRGRKDRRFLENLAKEDARYILSLATQTQVGATINARNLELMIRRFASQDLIEIKELGSKLYRLVKRVAPSIILFCEANAYDRETYREVRNHARNVLTAHPGENYHDVQLIDHTRGGDERILAALLSGSTGRNYRLCWSMVRKMSRRKKLGIFKEACSKLELYDSMLREFEFADLCYSVIVSAGCFGQLKRHRMASMVWSDYDPNLGVTVPEAVKVVGEEGRFLEIIDRTNRIYGKIERRFPGIGSYILTNAHRRQVIIKVNVRELYHMSRLREDPTAQWDIRGITHKMSALARKAMPITTALLGGKSDYPEVYRKLYGRYPKVKHVPLP